MNDLPIRLRDATLADADLLDAWSSSPEAKGEFNDLGTPPGDDSVREALENGPLRNERNGQLIVERAADGNPIGTVGWHEVHYGPPPESRAWNIGISLIPEARGHGFGGIAQRLLADYLLETTDAHRVEAQTDVDNFAEQRALEKAGFVREGIARGSQFRASAYHDLVTYSRLCTDPELHHNGPSVIMSRMIRTQISLTEGQMRELRRLARRRGVSIAALVRTAVDKEINGSGMDEARRRAAAAVGGFRSGLPDVGLRHDDYLAEDFLK